jgi:pantothenate kinase-related protein Tda10
MLIEEKEIELLKRGEPPINSDILKIITIGRELWLDFFKEYYLNNFIYQGGSKVKVVVGSEGTGKTHLLRCIEQEARDQGYATVFFSLRDFYFKLNDLV